jgi:hypothetical protein
MYKGHGIKVPAGLLPSTNEYLFIKDGNGNPHPSPQKYTEYFQHFVFIRVPFECVHSKSISAVFMSWVALTGISKASDKMCSKNPM